MVQAIQTTRSKKQWTSGLPMIALSGSLMLAYFRLSRFTEDWTVSTHILFRAVTVLIGMVGLAQVAAGTTGSRGGIASPRIGRNRVVLATEGAVYLAIMFVLFTGAMLTKQNTLLLVFTVMAGPFVVNGWLTFGMLQAARISRVVPKRSMAGELFDVELTLANRHPFLSAWVMLVRDEVADAGQTLSAEVLFARVPARGEQTGNYSLRLSRRGRHRFGNIQISSRYPLGLVERSRIYGVPGEILVHPRVGRVHPHWKHHCLGATELVARPQHNAGIFHDEFHGLREFRTGDNPRDIHWRSSARRGQLILREYQQNRDVHLAVILDLWMPSQNGTRSSSISVETEALRGGKAFSLHADLIEMVLSFGLTLVIQHGRECRESHLHLLASGATTLRWDGQAIPASLESLLDGLAVIQGGAAEESKSFLEETIQNTSSSTQIVVVSTRPDNPDDGFNRVLGNPRVHVLRLLSPADCDAVMTMSDASHSTWEDRQRVSS